MCSNFSHLRFLLHHLLSVSRPGAFFYEVFSLSRQGDERSQVGNNMLKVPQRAGGESEAAVCCGRSNTIIVLEL